MQAITLTERPDLFDATFRFGYAEADGSAFMQASAAGLLVSAHRLARRWPDYVLALLDGNEVVGRAVCVPFSSSREDRDPFPAGGWDQIVVWAAEDALDAEPVNEICALEIAVDPKRRGSALAAEALSLMRAHARALGYARLVAPLRPPGKAAYPTEPIDEYVQRRHADGLPEDWWLRLHERVGAEMVGIAHSSGTIVASLRLWRSWTGLPFDSDGEVVVPGGLVPVLVSVRHDIGAYVEPNVWYQHALTS